MLLKFKHKKIKEFSNGAFRAVNDGKPFEVSETIGNELLKAQAIVEFGGDLTDVFEIETPKATKPPKEEKEGDK